MKHKNNGNRHNDDFRQMIVDLYHFGQSVKNLSGEFGVSEVTIYSWIKKLNPVEVKDGSSITPKDYTKLQKQLLKLQEENEILKAMAIFSKKVNDAKITDFIHHEKSKKCYGASKIKIYHELKKLGYIVDIKRVQRFMKNRLVT